MERVCRRTAHLKDHLGDHGRWPSHSAVWQRSHYLWHDMVTSACVESLSHLASPDYESDTGAALFASLNCTNSIQLKFNRAWSSLCFSQRISPYVHTLEFDCNTWSGTFYLSGVTMSIWQIGWTLSSPAHTNSRSPVPLFFAWATLSAPYSRKYTVRFAPPSASYDESDSSHDRLGSIFLIRSVAFWKISSMAS